MWENHFSFLGATGRLLGHLLSLRPLASAMLLIGHRKNRIKQGLVLDDRRSIDFINQHNFIVKYALVLLCESRCGTRP